MRRAARFGFALLPFLLAACGSSDDSGVLVEACVKDGGDKTYCACRGEFLAAELDDEDRALLVRMTRMQMDENINADEARERLFKDEGATRLMAFQFAVMAPLMKAEEKCR